MTHNPTPAEVQAAVSSVEAYVSRLSRVYDRAGNAITSMNHAGEVYAISKSDLDTLLAAVARDSLGWREVAWREWSKHSGPARLEYSSMADNGRHFIMDAAP
jgi:hypothetical protein